MVKAKWTPDMDDTLLYMKHYLQCTYAECTFYLHREFPRFVPTKKAVMCRITILKNKGLTTYQPQECEYV